MPTGYVRRCTHWTLPSAHTPTYARFGCGQNDAGIQAIQCATFWCSNRNNAASPALIAGKEVSHFAAPAHHLQDPNRNGATCTLLCCEGRTVSCAWVGNNHCLVARTAGNFNAVSPDGHMLTRHPEASGYVAGDAVFEKQRPTSASAAR